MEEKKMRILGFLTKERELEFLTEKLEMEDYEILGVVELLKKEGNNISTYEENGKTKLRYYPNYERKEQNSYELYDGRLKKLRFALISDTHLASKYDQLSILNKLYEEFDKRNIKRVLHCGDISDGYYKKKRDAHIYELKCIGSDEQAEYIIENYPKSDNITTFFITGNHDHTHVQNGGANIGKAISKERSDMVYLGADYAEIMINNCKIHLQHPGGGSAYARSYKLQKFIDAMKGGEKPHILAQGHFHKTFYMLYRNIHAFSVPSVQGPTPFTVSSGLGNDMGAWIIEAKTDKNGNIIYLVPELIPIYETENKRKVLKLK
ncbi:MAG: metallophosphoesterase family protein [Bacilli bacterium]|nr:metallophosphoesterase family protein [Bacilli bacterium]MDD4808838.1 metallophosphoesterase family protein [Bacilli bacterium]